MGKEHANKGVRRNKKPLQNILFKIEPNIRLRSNLTIEEETKFKDKFYLNDKLGYVRINWKYERDNMWYWSASLTLKKLKEYLTNKQWSKLCQGKTFEFTQQRRVNKKNI